MDGMTYSEFAVFLIEKLSELRAVRETVKERKRGYKAKLNDLDHLNRQNRLKVTGHIDALRGKTVEETVRFFEGFAQEIRHQIPNLRTDLTLCRDEVNYLKAMSRHQSGSIELADEIDAASRRYQELRGDHKRVNSLVRKLAPYPGDKPFHALEEVAEEFCQCFSYFGVYKNVSSFLGRNRFQRLLSRLSPKKRELDRLYQRYQNELPMIGDMKDYFEEADLDNPSDFQNELEDLRVIRRHAYEKVKQAEADLRSLKEQRKSLASREIYLDVHAQNLRVSDIINKHVMKSDKCFFVLGDVYRPKVVVKSHRPEIDWDKDQLEFLNTERRAYKAIVDHWDQLLEGLNDVITVYEGYQKRLDARLFNIGHKSIGQIDANAIEATVNDTIRRTNRSIQWFQNHRHQLEAPTQSLFANDALFWTVIYLTFAPDGEALQSATQDQIAALETFKNDVLIGGEFGLGDLPEAEVSTLHADNVLSVFGDGGAKASLGLEAANFNDSLSGGVSGSDSGFDSGSSSMSSSYSDSSSSFSGGFDSGGF